MFAGLYQEHHQAIYYLALRLLGDPSQAEDATHDVFLNAWRKFSEFRGDSHPRTWLYRIALNHCRNLLKSWQQRHISPATEPEMWDQLPSGGEGPLQVLETRELGERIQKTLDRLPHDYRLLLLLVADELLSYEEVANLTGQTVDAVRGKLHRARKAFAVVFAQLA